MKTYSISKLGKMFDLSRSTLLYYDRIGLLQAASRSPAGYRHYSEEDRDTLERIVRLRQAGLSLADVKQMLAGESGPSVSILEKRLQQLGEEILALRAQQHTITAMLKSMTSGRFAPVIDKRIWVEMLASAGMDEAAMRAWHTEFERRAPVAHHEFLLSLGIPENETQKIREWSRPPGKGPA